MGAGGQSHHSSSRCLMPCTWCWEGGGMPCGGCPASMARGSRSAGSLVPCLGEGVEDVPMAQVLGSWAGLSQPPWHHPHVILGGPAAGPGACKKTHYSGIS